MFYFSLAFSERYRFCFDLYIIVYFAAGWIFFFTVAIFLYFGTAHYTLHVWTMTLANVLLCHTRSQKEVPNHSG